MRKKDNEHYDVEVFYNDIFKEFLEKDYVKTKTAGQPRAFANPKEMAERCIDYFLYTKATGRPMHLEGLKVHLHMWNPNQWASYFNGKIKAFTEDFQKVAKIAHQIIVSQKIDKLYSSHFAAAKFDLMCNHGWVPAEKIINENHDIKVTIGKKPEQEQEED